MHNTIKTPPDHPPFHHIRHHIQQGLIQHSIPSLAVAVAQEQTLLWEEGFGWADRENSIPATPHTIYSLASITKPITATAVMILQERGLLNLDSPINTYLNNSPIHTYIGNLENATIRRVANHTAGFPNHYHVFYQDEPYQPPSIQKTIQHYAYLSTIPGERYLYSNIGYGLLGEVIAHVSGKSYPDFLRDEIFLPLGMLSASVNVTPALQAFQARQYGSDGIPYPITTSDHPGASDIYCSAHDLIRFGMFHSQQRLPDQKTILSDASLHEMQIPTTQQGDGTTYGIGWGLSDEIDGYHLVTHSGGMGGVSTSLEMIPEAQTAVVVLMNITGASGRFFKHQIIDEIFDLLLPTYAEKRAQHTTNAKSQTPSEPKQDTPLQQLHHLHGKWTGQLHTYEGDLPLTLWIQTSGDIHAQLGSQPKTPLTAIQFKEDSLTGIMPSEIELADAKHHPHHLSLDLKLHNDTLKGTLTTTSKENREGGAPKLRMSNMLSHWTELKKDEATSF